MYRWLPILHNLRQRKYKTYYTAAIISLLIIIIIIKLKFPREGVKDLGTRPCNIIA